MAQDLEGPVRITVPKGGRETGLEADSVHIGRSSGTVLGTGKKKATPVLGILRGPILPGQQVDDDGVFVDADNVPKVPAVALHIGDRQAAGGIWVQDDEDRSTITMNGITGTGTFGTDDGQAGSVVLRSGGGCPAFRGTSVAAS